MGKKVAVMTVNVQRHIQQRQIDLPAVSVSAKDQLREIFSFTPVKRHCRIRIVRDHDIEFIHIKFRDSRSAGTDISNAAKDQTAFGIQLIFQIGHAESGIKIFPEMFSQPVFAVLPVPPGGKRDPGMLTKAGEDIGKIVDIDRIAYHITSEEQIIGPVRREQCLQMPDDTQTFSGSVIVKIGKERYRFTAGETGDLRQNIFNRGNRSSLDEMIPLCPLQIDFLPT